LLYGLQLNRFIAGVKASAADDKPLVTLPRLTLPAQAVGFDRSHAKRFPRKGAKSGNCGCPFFPPPLQKTGISRKEHAMTVVSVQLRPLGDRIVVRALARETVTKSGIVLPDTAKEKPQEGEILAVGPGKVLDNGKRTTLEVQVGQRVLFAKYAGTEVKIDNEELLILRESDVMGIVE